MQKHKDEGRVCKCGHVHKKVTVYCFKCGAVMSWVKVEYQWKMYLPNIWHLIDPKGKVLAKVFRSAFRRTKRWTVWMPPKLDSQHHNTLKDAAVGAQKVWTL